MQGLFCNSICHRGESEEAVAAEFWRQAGTRGCTLYCENCWKLVFDDSPHYPKSLLANPKTLAKIVAFKLKHGHL